MPWCHRLDADYGMDPWIWQSLDGPSFCLSSKLCLCNSFHGWLFPILRRSKVSKLWSSFFSFMCFASCTLYLAILSFWANIHLSVSTFHLSSFVIGFFIASWWGRLRAPRRRCLNTPLCSVFAPDWLLAHYLMLTPQDGRWLGVNILLHMRTQLVN